MSLTFIDWLVMLVYFAFVIGIGLIARRYTKTSEDFFRRDARFRHGSPA